VGWVNVGKSMKRETDGAQNVQAPNVSIRLTNRSWLRSKQVIGDCVAIMDGLLIAASAVLAKWLYIGVVLSERQHIDTYAYIGLAAGLVAVLILRSQGLYAADQIARLRGQTRRMLFGLLMTALLLISAAYMLKVSSDFSRGWFITWFALAAMLGGIWHFSVALTLKHLTRKGLFVRHVAIYGSGEMAAQIIEHLQASDSDRRVVGIFDDLSRGQSSKVVTAGGLSDLIRRGQSEYFDEVLVALSFQEQDRITSVISELAVLPVDVRLCPDFVTFKLRPKGLLNYNGATIFEVERRPLDAWAPVLKGLEDRVLSALGLWIAAPLMLLIALAIKLDSRGPVFFRQRRHGFNHEIINVWKFRTMHVLEDGGQVPQAKRGDPRVTRVGRFLRSTSLDELPQLFNVLRGEMSIVGQRPHAIAHNEYYSAMLQRYANRHRMKPGITGWAQVRGYRGETDTPEKMDQRVRCDLEYIENWSLWFDVKIILMTPFYGFVNRNAF
jgi:Undecaprenyl-phosphate glucose phosphotransferase